MAVFDDLPNEIIDNICRFGVPLKALCLTSKKCHRIAQSHLYATVEISEGNDIAFIRTIRNADARLCAYVHELKLESVILDSGDIDKDDRAKFGLPPVSSEGPVELPQQCAEMILSKVPALESLKLMINYNQVFNAEGNARSFSEMWKAYPSPPSLPKLRSLSLWFWDSQEGFDLNLVLPLISIAPRLTTIHALACNNATFARTWSFPSVKELTLENSALAEEGFAVLVNAFPLLESLCIRTGHSTRWLDTDEEIGTAAINRVLGPLQQSLKHLTIDQSEAFDGTEEHNVDGGQIESLVGFEKLQSLEIWQKDIIETNEEDDSDNDSDGPDTDPMALQAKLPSSLQTLHVTQSDENLDPYLMCLAGQAATNFRALRTVIVEYRPADEVRMALEQANIELKIQRSTRPGLNWIYYRTNGDVRDE